MILQFGIETLEVYSKKHLGDKLLNYNDVLHTKTIELRHGTSFVLRNHLSTELSSYNEIKDRLQELSSQLNTDLYITRIDLSFNTMIDISKNMTYEISKLFMHGIKERSGISSDVARWYRGFELGNITLKNSSTKHFTWYNSKDKTDRGWDSRLEFQFARIPYWKLNQAVKSKLDLIKEYLKFTDKDYDNLSMDIAHQLSDLYLKELNTGAVSSFKDFVIRYEHEFLTNKCFREFFKSHNDINQIQEWKKAYRKINKENKRRGLELVEKKYFKLISKEFQK
jgi:hypothetical protein